jgi:hypothetical protein
MLGCLLFVQQAAIGNYDKMQACAGAFEAERLLRMTPEERARFEQVFNMPAEEEDQ